MHVLPEALRPFAAYRQFIICKFVPDQSRPGKTNKYPIHPLSGIKTNAHEPSIWMTHEEAIALAPRFGVDHGVGFVFTVNDPFFFIDVDECIKPEGYTPIVAELAALLPNAVMEVSHSGRGLHIFGMGQATTERRVKDKTNLLFDLYTDDRFVALTGTGICGTMLQYDYTPSLAVLVERHLKRETGEVTGWTTEAVEGWHGPDNDDQLIERALRSQSANSAFGSKASFSDLWSCNVEALAKHFPPERSDSTAYNASQVDSALAQHLAFWTGKNCERILNLMMRSALVREKWSERDDYLKRTILGVVSIQKNILTDKHPEPLATMATPGMSTAAGETARATAVTGNTYLGIDESIELFSGCVYVSDVHRVMVPGGLMLRPDQFRVTYGGYNFQMDDLNRKNTRNAWEAFTESQVFRAPRVERATFRPELQPGAIITVGGSAQVNTFFPINTERKTGDLTMFLTHLRKLLPNERDQTILLSYMAALVQHKGYKFQWCPFIQGVEGNGKTFFSRCVDFAIGERYTHWPRASDIHEKFNFWQRGKIFIAVEDICIPESNKSTWEILKPMITGDKQSLEPKGVDQATFHICCNYILNGNSKNGIPKTQNDRRAAPLFTAQQSESDLRRDGMLGEYVVNLYRWAKAGGYAIVSELLHTYPIPPEFDPTGMCQRAPTTTSTDEAIGESLGRLEQEIIEAIGQEMPGFCDGWVSSMALDKLIQIKGGHYKMPHNQRRNMLQKLGYDWHPGLLGGRVNNVIEPDGGKPRLFIRSDSPARMLQGSDVAKAYTESQVKYVFSK